MSLRLRLTILCVALVAAVLVGFAVTTYVIARQGIYNSFDDSLNAEALAILGLLPPGSLSEPLGQATRSQLDTQAAAGLLFQIRTNDGNVLYSSFSGSPALLPRDRSLAEEAFYEANVADQTLRLLYLPVDPAGDGGFSIEVGRSTNETAEALSELRYALAAGSLLAVFLTLVPAYYIAGRGLRPVRDVSRLARRIELTGDYSQRLAERRSSDETGELIATFNAMIDRVDGTLAAQTEFLAESSHELRRPLTVLRTNLDILRDPGLPAADRAACLERMSVEARSMSALVGDLLLLTRDKTQSLQRLHVDISSLCSDEVSRFNLGTGQATIESQIEPGLVVIGDEERLRQMLKNLLENAVNYTPPSGQVEAQPEQRRRRRPAGGARHGHRHRGGRPGTGLRSLLPGRCCTGDARGRRGPGPGYRQVHRRRARRHDQRRPDAGGRGHVLRRAAARPRGLRTSYGYVGRLLMIP